MDRPSVSEPWSPLVLRPRSPAGLYRVCLYQVSLRWVSLCWPWACRGSRSQPTPPVCLSRRTGRSRWTTSPHRTSPHQLSPPVALRQRETGGTPRTPTRRRRHRKRCHLPGGCPPTGWNGRLLRLPLMPFRCANSPTIRTAQPHQEVGWRGPMVPTQSTRPDGDRFSVTGPRQCHLPPARLAGRRDVLVQPGWISSPVLPGRRCRRAPRGSRPTRCCGATCGRQPRPR